MPATLSPTGCRERALKAIAKLPPFSPVLNQLISSLTNDSVSIGELATLIEKDTVIAGNLLRLCNSAIYARRGTVNSIRHGISILGLAKLRNAAMSWSLARMWNTQKYPEGWSTNQFNLHGVACGIMADLLAVDIPCEYGEGAFAAGLLANVGMLLVALSAPEDFEQVHRHYLQDERAFERVERELLGVDHADLSTETLKQWNLPAPIVRAVAEHHILFDFRPGQTVPLGYVIQQADRLVGQQAIGFQDWHRPEPGTPEETLATLGLESRSSAILERFRGEFEALRGFFQ
ncbi:MAG: HDOD domain-containing protein [Bryobacteraceae bacterium]